MTQANLAILGRILLILPLLLPAGLAIGAPLPGQPDPVKGKALAERLCTNCHLVGDPQQGHANADVPSFHEIGNAEGQTAAAITAHIILPKHPMPQISVTKSELADLSAYILSLRDDAGRQ
jgi:mono/diheme cytochrome c family protein